MMLAEEYALEAKRLIADLQIEVAREKFRYIVRLRLEAWIAQFGQEFK